MSRVIVILTGLTVFSMATVWNNLQIRKLQYRITETQKELRRERRSYKQVRLQFEQLRSPVRLRNMMKKRKLNLISTSESGHQLLTPHEMKRVIRQRRLVSGKESEGAQYAIRVGQ